MTLATRLPWTHPFSGGYPRIGGQPLPTDPDAIDYLSRVAAADGAAVEVGVAMAVDQFVKGCKADSAGYAGDPTRTVWDAIKACCIMAGARTISGALVPLVGDSPTPYNLTNFDYARTTGIKGDGSTTYLDSNRAGNADGQDDNHASVYVASQATSGSVYIENRDTATSDGYIGISRSTTDSFFRSSSDGAVSVAGLHDGFLAVSRGDSAGITARASGTNYFLSLASQSQSSLNVLVFDRQNTSGKTDARLAFYSLGSSLDLAALDNRVSTLISSISTALS